MRIKTLIFLLLICPLAHSQSAKAVQDDKSGKWQAGSLMTREMVEKTGLDNCFRADTLSEDVFARMKGRSYPAGCPIERSQLRYLRLLHYNKEGEIRRGEMVCNVAIATDLLEIFRELYVHRYPIERMMLVDNYDADDERSMCDNNTSCFCYRHVAGTKKLSKHAQGLAVDINTLYNPYVKTRSDGTLIVQPSKALRYANRAKSFPYKIEKGDLCHRLFLQHGFTWGGSWRYSKDYQHFEK
ncbi:MAG: M15 family metallopeptidase [Prevotella sp.]|nr:M15 family metallopeptidase [Prevotella sp.]